MTEARLRGHRPRASVHKAFCNRLHAETEDGVWLPRARGGQVTALDTGVPVVMALSQTLLVVGDLTSQGTEEHVHCTANYMSTETLPYSVSPPASPNMTCIQAVTLCSATV